MGKTLPIPFFLKDLWKASTPAEACLVSHHK
jgi:hypothetical protein